MTESQVTSLGCWLGGDVGRKLGGGACRDGLQVRGSTGMSGRVTALGTARALGCSNLRLSKMGQNSD